MHHCGMSAWNLPCSRIRGGRRFSWYSDCSQLCIGARLLLFAVAAVISSCYSCSCRSVCCSCFLLLFTCFHSSASICFLLLPLLPLFPLFLLLLLLLQLPYTRARSRLRVYVSRVSQDAASPCRVADGWRCTAVLRAFGVDVVLICIPMYTCI